nr:cytochrome b/b6 domain-containing protein [Azospirillum sp. TSO22-1]
MSGAFLVAYLTGDEDTYRMHVFSGYAALAALVARVIAGLTAADGSPLRFPRPSIEDLRHWVARLAAGDPQARAGRSPLLPWMAAALLIGAGATALSGAVADFVTLVEDLHEALGEVALWIVLGHIALVLALHHLKRPRPLGATA